MYVATVVPGPVLVNHVLDVTVGQPLHVVGQGVVVGATGGREH